MERIKLRRLLLQPKSLVLSFPIRKKRTLSITKSATWLRNSHLTLIFLSPRYEEKRKENILILLSKIISNAKTLKRKLLPPPTHQHHHTRFTRIRSPSDQQPKLLPGSRGSFRHQLESDTWKGPEGTRLTAFLSARTRGEFSALPTVWWDLFWTVLARG